MIKFLLTTFLLSFMSFSVAQSIPKVIVASSGEPLSNGTVNLNFTFGEPLIGPILNEYEIAQGFWAGGFLVEPMVSEEELEGIQIFPNPVDNELNIFTNNNPIYAITLYAVNGKRTLRRRVDASLIEHKIDMSHLSKGMYILRLYVEEIDEAKLFKIIKK